MSEFFAEEATKQFYHWERRGRGWDIASQPIDLEPEFAPFFIQTTNNQAIIDDGKRPTFLGSFFNLFTKSTEKALPSPALESYELYPFIGEDELVYYQLFIPKQYTHQQHATERLLHALSLCRSPVSFEIIGKPDEIVVQLVCRSSSAAFVYSQLSAYFPNMLIVDIGEKGRDNIGNDDYYAYVDFGLDEEFMRPLSIGIGHGDSYASLFGILDQLRGTEGITYQVLFSGLLNSWEKSIVEAVTSGTGSSFFYDAPEMPKLAIEKSSSPLFAVTVRLCVHAATLERVNHLAHLSLLSLLHISKSPWNSLALLTTDTYPFEIRQDDFVDRTSHRSGMILNSKELANLMHIPSATLSDKLILLAEKTKAAPAPEGTYILGTNTHNNNTVEVRLSTQQRLKHVHIIGATGTGKSTLLQNLIVQDLEQGEGVAVLDPHGDLIEYIIERIPEHRIHDVIVIDPSDTTNAVSLNILSAHSAIEKEILASDLVALFRRFSSSWGDQMNSVFANAILAFLESTTGGTLADLRRFLIEKPYRDEFLKTVQDDHIVYYWQKEYPLLKSSSIGSILTRLDAFLRPKIIRNMVCQKTSLDFEQILDSKKIVLVKLSHGLIGSENSYLLGSFIVSKLQQAAMARQAKDKAQRQPYFVYIDEFHQFTTHSMSLILEGARKYGLGLILAHQSMQQLQKQDSEIAHSVLTNAGTRICLRLGEQDARLFGNSFSAFAGEDLQRLSVGNAIVRIDRSDNDFNLKINQQDHPCSSIISELIIEQSHRKYALPTELIEPMKSITSSSDEHTEPPKSTVKEHSTERLVNDEVSQPIQITEPNTETNQVPPPVHASTTIEKLVRQKAVSQHRQLQTLIKKLAEGYGYKAVIEKPILNNAGKVDVSLEKDKELIACEISCTTDAAWEFHNIEKCITAGYQDIFVFVQNSQTQQDLTMIAQQKNLQHVRLMQIEDLARYFASKAGPPPETVIKGYRVKVSYGDISSTEHETKEHSIKRILRGRTNRT